MHLKPSNALTLIAFAAAALALHLVKYWVQDVRKDVVAMESELAREKEDVHLLKAEWAYLNRPERLRELSQKYLSVEPMSSTRVAAWESLPSRADDATLPVKFERGGAE